MAVHGRVRFPRVVRLRFWEGVRSGLSVKEAAAAAGVSRNSGWTWMAERGGVMPLVPSPGQIRPRLTLEQREEIAALKAARLTNSEIAREIGVHRSTIGRELAAGSTVFPDRHPKYKPSVAQAASEQRAKRDRPGKLATDPVLLAEVQARLEDEHSPEQIAERLKMDFPDDEDMRVSHETIYKALYVQGRGELRRDLHLRLRTGRALRKPRRATGFVTLLHLPEDHGADADADAMVAAMSRLPETLRQTLTWDQGREMTNHVTIAAATDLDIYFCDPHSPWQRGTNENTNGLLRQYFAKGSDLSVFAPDYLEHVAAKLNNRPRQRLGFKTPAEALDELLSEPFDPTAVASTA